jgi:predicted ArsR family transcriptional regulator
MSSADPWDALHLLAEPTRRRIFEAVRAADLPVTREEVAAAAGVTRRLAAFHLDLLAKGGLLVVDFARPAGRSGPGAGRPAKRYRPAPVEIELSVPARRYDVAARILARAVDVSDGSDVRATAYAVAREEGERVGRLRRPRRRMSTRASLDEATVVLADLGYEPHPADASCVRLRNCPFHAVVDVATELVCGVNEGFIGGVLTGLGVPRSVSARLDGVPPDCCVTVARR